MITLHGLKTCDTCRKAMKSLATAGLEGSLRDLRADPLTEAEARTWSEALGPALLNTRSTTWRGLDAAARDGDPVALMVAHPALVKRPVVQMEDGTLHLGWTAETRAALGL